MAIFQRCASMFAAWLLLASVAPVSSRLLRSHGAAATGHPIENVIGLLKKLDGQVEEEAKAEELSYEKFEHWCARSTKALKEQIAESKSKIQSLQEVIDSRAMTIEVLDKEVDALTTEIDGLAKAQNRADSLRKAGADLFKAESESLTGTIDAVRNALKELSDTGKDVSLLQSRIRNILALVGSRASAAQRSLLQTFATEDPKRPELKAGGDNEEHVDQYSFKSDSVVEMLKGLLIDFKKDLVKRTREETNAVNAYELEKAANEDSAQAATSSKTEKEDASGEASEELGVATGQHKDRSQDLAADEGTLSSTQQACEVKAAEWAERSKTRDGEREAIAKAIEILAKVTGVRTESPDNPVPPASPAFLQLESPVQQALNLLRKEALITHSDAIAQLVRLVAAKKQGPFDKVMNEIEKMVFRLKKEQMEDDKHKNWCDKELSKTNASLEDKDDKIEELNDKINVAKSRAQVLKKDITAADDMVADLTSHMKEATELRKEGKQENSLAVKDAEAAQTAVTEAVAVLKDFYKDSGMVEKEAYEFIQRAPVDLPEKPSTWDSSYTGVADPVGEPSQPGGIVTVLETISADFARMEAETIAQEESDQHEYEQDVKDSKIEKARRTKESEMKNEEREGVVSKQVAMQKEHNRVATERDATAQYLDDLQPACVKGDSTYEERKAARADEIAGLKEAKSILQDAFINAKSK